MTRRRLTRLRRKYNANRRIDRGWTPKQWNRLCTDSWAQRIDDEEYEWWLRYTARVFEA